MRNRNNDAAAQAKADAEQVEARERARLEALGLIRPGWPETIGHWVCRNCGCLVAPFLAEKHLSRCAP